MKKINLLLGSMLVIGIVLLSVLLLRDRSSSAVPDYNLQEIREIAWNILDDRAIQTITMKKEEAQIELIEANKISFIPYGEDEKKQIEAIRNSDTTVIKVTFLTEQDGLLGPIVLIIDPEVIEVIGLVPRY